MWRPGTAIDCEFTGGLAYREVFLYRVTKGVIEEQVKNRLKSKNISFDKVIIKAHKDARFESFVISVKLEHYETVLDCSMWPKNCFIRSFHFRYNNKLT